MFNTSRSDNNVNHHGKRDSGVVNVFPPPLAINNDQNKLVAARVIGCCRTVKRIAKTLGMGSEKTY